MGFCIGFAESNENVLPFLECLVRKYEHFVDVIALTDYGTAIHSYLDFIGILKKISCLFHVKKNVETTFSGTSSVFLDGVAAGLARASKESQIKEWFKNVTNQFPSHKSQIQYLLERRAEFASFELLLRGIFRKNSLVSLCETVNGALLPARRRGICTMTHEVLEKNVSWLAFDLI